MQCFGSVTGAPLSSTEYKIETTWKYLRCQHERLLDDTLGLERHMIEVGCCIPELCLATTATNNRMIENGEDVIRVRALAC